MGSIGSVHMTQLLFLPRGIPSGQASPVCVRSPRVLGKPILLTVINKKEVVMMNSTQDILKKSSQIHQDPRTDVRDHIFEAVRRENECDLEELVRVCSSCTWNQVFLEVDRLSRTGELRLLPKGNGFYAVRLPL